MSHLEKTLDKFLKVSTKFAPELNQFRYYEGLDKAIKIYRDPDDRRIPTDFFSEEKLLECILPFYETPSKCIIFKPSIDLIQDAISTNVTFDNIRIFYRQFEYEYIHFDTYKLSPKIETNNYLEKLVFDYLINHFTILDYSDRKKDNFDIDVTNSYSSMKNSGLTDSDMIEMQMLKLCMICNIQYQKYLETQYGFQPNPPPLQQLSKRVREGKNKSKKHPMFKPIYVNTNRSIISRKTNLNNQTTKRRKVDYSIKVKRHIRNQPCGKGRKDIKQIWIEEHIRGTGVLIEKTKNVIFK